MFPQRIVIISLILLALASCKKESTQWDTYNILPLAQGRLQLNDLIADTLLTAGNDSIYRIVGTFDLINLDPTKDIAIPDTFVTKDLSLAFTLTVPPGTEFINDVENTTFQDIDAELTEVIVFSGTINYVIKNPIQEDLSVTYTIPGATLAGVPFTYTRLIPAGTQANPSISTGLIDLSGYRIDLRSSSGTLYNTLQTQVSVSTPGTAASVTVTPADTVHVETYYSGLVPSYAKGFFGQINQQETSAGDTLDVFRNIIGGALQIDDLHAELRITNNIGADARVRLNELRAANSSTGADVALAHPIIGTDQNFSRAIDANGTPIPFVKVYPFNNLNSNIIDFLEVLPNRMIYDVEVALNPLGNVSGHNDFLYRSYPFLSQLYVDAPLHIGADGLVLLDTLQIEPFTGDIENNLEWAELQCEIENAFPISAQVKIILPNENGNLMDTIAVAGSIQAGIAGTGSHITPVISSLSFRVTINQLKAMDTFGQLALLVQFDSPAPGSTTPLYSNYYLDALVKLYMKNPLSF